MQDGPLQQRNDWQMPVWWDCNVQICKWAKEMTMNELDFYFFLSLLVSQRCSLVQYSIEKRSTKVLRKGEEF